MKSFKEYVEQKKEKTDKDWRKEYINLPKGFIPPKNMAPIVQAFLDSGSIELTKDTSKSVTMPKKSLFMVGGPVRDFLTNPSKRPKDYDLATNATPQQTALILHNAGFEAEKPEEAEKLNIPSGESKSDGDKKWFIKGHDASGKPFVIGAVVGGEVFDIATFRSDGETVNGQSDVEFKDNPHDDAERRDFTINAMYIELTKADGENKKLYDPTRKGYHDIFSGTVRTVGKAEKRFEEDKIRVMRAIRFHCKFGRSKPIDGEMAEAIPKFAHLEGVASERIREEFLKGLEDPEVDPKKYMSLYQRFGLLSKVFPGVKVKTDLPPQLRDKKDKFVALAWMLQDNPKDIVDSALGSGWSNQEKSLISYLISLKEFDPDNLEDLLKSRRNLGVTKDQIRRWADMFDVVDGGSVRSSRPAWSKRIRTFSGFEPDQRNLVTWFSKDDTGNTTGEVHPEIVSSNLAQTPPHLRGSVLRDMNRKRLAQMFDAT
jgi:tRNA nucleotidyltransferase/poly(A) polymerase